MAKKVAKIRKPAAGLEQVAKLAKPGKFVYFFGDGKADGNRYMKDTLGGKGSGLAEMTNAGLPVPAGFTISTPVCAIYYKEGGRIPASIEKEMLDNLRKLEKSAGRRLGDTSSGFSIEPSFSPAAFSSFRRFSSISRSIAAGIFPFWL